MAEALTFIGDIPAGTIFMAPGTGTLAALPIDTAAAAGRPGAGFAVDGSYRPQAGTPMSAADRGGLTEMQGVTIRPGVVNVATKEVGMQRNATEPSGSKWKWYHWAIVVVLLLAVVYGGFLLYKKYK